MVIPNSTPPPFHSVLLSFPIFPFVLPLQPFGSRNPLFAHVFFCILLFCFLFLPRTNLVHPMSTQKYFFQIAMTPSEDEVAISGWMTWAEAAAEGMTLDEISLESWREEVRAVKAVDPVGCVDWC